MPASSAASITARVPARSSRRPKLLQPRPTADTVSPERPSGFSCMARRMAARSATVRGAPPPTDVRRRRRRSTFSSSAAGPGGCAGCSPCSAAAGGGVPVAPIVRARRAAWRSRRARSCSCAARDDGRGPVARRRAAVRRRVGARRPRGRLAADDGADARGAAAARCSRTATARRRARRSATRVRVGRGGEPRDGKVTVPVVITTRLFGELRGTIDFPVERTGDTARRRVDARPAPAGARAGRARAAARAAPAAARVGARRRRAPAEPRGHRRRAREQRSRSGYAARLGGRPGRRAALRQAGDREGRAGAGPVGADDDPPVAAGRGDGGARRPAGRRRRDRARATATCSRSPGSAVTGHPAAGLVVQDRHARRRAGGRGDRAGRVVPRADRGDARGRGGCATRATSRAAARSPSPSRTRATRSSARSARGSARAGSCASPRPSASTSS